ncbi:CbrC family protein [Proteus sp. WDL240414]|uniref:CbrC family protein n=1 Tax=Proteus columbae TaxID=1987580 RepID=A0A6I7DI77_9GAMM|nr:CbrC family protein [Proteus mirabilis]MBG3019041.1 CbrC family protein [Proteus mirabilis]QHN12577.1 CbrC family protein [Proteus columbae]
MKYHPEPIKTGAFITDDTVICDCCGKLRLYIDFS